MFGKLFKKKDDLKNRPVYNDFDAINFIEKDTGIDRLTIRRVLNSDLRYQKSVGIIDWPDLEDFLNELTEKLKSTN